MTGYLLVETQGRWSGPGAVRFAEDAARLAAAGHRVVLFLVQDGIDSALGTLSPSLVSLTGAGGEVWADEFSVAQRATYGSDLDPAVTEVPLAKAVDLLLEPGVRTVWH